ncbi:hypothetical protein LINGRAHAP2_LOCUS25962 [Linum grandiflorum]
MHSQLHIRPLLPVRRAQEVRQSPQSLRRKQCEQAPYRGSRRAARRHREFPCLRGRSPPHGPRLRLHWRHRHAPAQDG